MQADIPWQRQEHTIPPACRGEACTLCGAQATHKVAEEPTFEGSGIHHGHTAYLCERHFRRVMQPWQPEKPAATLDHIDALRSLAQSLGCILTHDWSDEAADAVDAADHLDDLAGQVLALEGDCARLNARVEAGETVLDRLAQWVQFARGALPYGAAAFPLPSDFLQYQKAKETPTP